MTITIELATAPTDDVRTLVAELEATLSAEYPPEQRHGLSIEALFAPNVRFYLARTEGHPVGCGGVAFFPDFAEVKRMYVRPHARGTGVAAAILSSVEAITRDEGLALLRLETGANQAAALKLYERTGFRRCDPFGTYALLPPHSIAASVFLEKPLALI